MSIFFSKNKFKASLQEMCMAASGGFQEEQRWLFPLFGKGDFSTVALFGKVTLAKLKDVVVGQERMWTLESELQKALIVAPFRFSVLEINTKDALLSRYPNSRFWYKKVI